MRLTRILTLGTLVVVTLCSCEDEEKVALNEKLKVEAADLASELAKSQQALDEDRPKKSELQKDFDEVKSKFELQKATVQQLDQEFEQVKTERLQLEEELEDYKKKYPTAR